MTLHSISYHRSERENPFKLALPLSKSESNRVLLINAVAGMPYDTAYAECDDTNAMLEAISSQSNYVNIGAAGTAMRFLTAYFAAKEGVAVVLDGSERMRQRPIAPLVDALRQAGAKIEYTMEDGYPPLRIYGRKLVGGDVDIDAGISSQFISALMMVAPVMERPLAIHLSGSLTSSPYVMMTASLMRMAGASVEVGEKCIAVENKPYSQLRYEIEGDRTAATYWYEICALSGRKITITNLHETSMQGDCLAAEHFERLGVTTVYDSDGNTVLIPTGLTNRDPIKIDFNSIPDTAQTFAVTCAVLHIPFVFTGLGTLPRKETDRLAALVDELGNLGYEVKSNGKDTLSYDGVFHRRKGERPVKTYKDHRMAMAFAPAAIFHPGLTMEDIAVVSKSYPEFFTNLEAFGFEIQNIG